MFKWQGLFITIITGLLLLSSSASARFYSVDPVGFQESNSISFNRYGYANNNPYGFTDPNGEQPNPMNGGGSINAQIDLHGNTPEKITTELAQATQLLDSHPRTNYTFNAYPDQMTKFASLKEKYGKRVAFGTHVNPVDKIAGTIKSQIAVGYKAASSLGQKPEQTALAAHGSYSKDAEKAILAHMKGPKDLYRLNAKTLAKDKPLAERFKNKDSYYFGHLKEMNDGSEKGKEQNKNFDHIENNLAE